MLKHPYSFILLPSGLYPRVDWQVGTKAQRAHVLALSLLTVVGGGTLGGRQLDPGWAVGSVYTPSVVAGRLSTSHHSTFTNLNLECENMRR